MESHPYTCISCSLAFSSAALQRSHYSTDHHRYNAQRKIAGLPPITAESFNQKVLERRQDSKTAAAAAEKLYCDVCRKNFASPNAYDNHLKSRKHKEAELAPAPAPKDPSVLPIPLDQPAEPVELSQQSAAILKNAAAGNDADAAALKAHLEKRVRHAHFIPPLQCLFCTQTLPDLPAKMQHMHTQHGFFVPDRDYLVDEAGLVHYLAEVLSLWNACLFCGAAFSSHVESAEEDKSEEEQAAEERKRSRRSLEAVRNHMTSKNHCKIPWDTEEERLELSDFYDFTKSYDDDDEDVEEGAEDWEDASDAGSSDADMVVEDEDETRPARKNGRIQYGDTPFELVLPSGKRVGHRALRNIYKQNIVPAMQRQDAQMLKLTKHLTPRPPTAQTPARSNALVKSNLDQMVLAGKLTKSAAKKASKPEQAQQQQERFRTKVGMRHNNQAHFRQELLQ